MPYWRWRSLFEAVTRSGHRVLWVDHFSSWGKREMLAYLRADPRRLVGSLSPETKGMRVLTSPLRIPRRDGPLAAAAAASAARAIRRAIRDAGFESPLLWASAPSAEALIGKIGESGVLYDCADDLRSLGADEVTLAREARIESRADVVLTCMPSVQALKVGRSRRVVCVPNGVDAAHFRAAARPGSVPPRVAGLRRPIVGYSGVVYDRIDWDMVDAVCSMRPDWSFVFMGLIQQPPPKRLERLANLHFFGEVAFEDLPDYYRGVDVCWIPHKVNALTSRQSSLKVLEYLAAGRPAVATDIPVPSDLQPFLPIAGSPIEMVELLELATGRDSDEDRAARCDAAAPHSWDASFAQIKEVAAAVSV